MNQIEGRRDLLGHVIRFVQRLLEEMPTRPAGKGGTRGGMVGILAVSLGVTEQHRRGRLGKPFLSGDGVRPGGVGHVLQIADVLAGEDHVVVRFARIDLVAPRALMMRVVDRFEPQLARLALVPLIVLPAARRKGQRPAEVLGGALDDFRHHAVFRSASRKAVCSRESSSGVQAMAGCSNGCGSVILGGCQSSANAHHGPRTQASKLTSDSHRTNCSPPLIAGDCSIM